MIVRVGMIRAARIAAFAAAGFALAGCQSFQQATGAVKSPPNEFAVLTKAPLIIPPDYNLRPPQPGAPDANQLAPADEARALLLNQDPQAVAAALAGDYSAGERALLAGSGGATVSPEIRRQISEAVGQEDRGEEFARQILFPEQAPAAQGAQ